MDSRKVEVAKRALVTGSAHIINLFGKGMDELGTEYKPTEGDTPRTLIDRHSEAAILEVIRGDPEFRDDLINAEETGESGHSGKRTWYIDPYDGTSNAQIRLPMSTSGIGISEDGRLVASVILNPFERSVFSAEIGRGAYVQEFSPETGELGPLRRIQTDTSSVKSNLRFAWVDSLFNVKTTPRKLEWIAQMHEAGLFQNLRATGSNIDYSARLADGRGHFQLTDAVGGYFDLCGHVLIEEAGGKMVNLDGRQPTPKDKIAIAVANPADLDRVLDITRRCYNGYEGFK